MLSPWSVSLASFGSSQLTTADALSDWFPQFAFGMDECCQLGRRHQAHRDGHSVKLLADVGFRQHSADVGVDLFYYIARRSRRRDQREPSGTDNARVGFRHGGDVRMGLDPL